MAGPKQAAKLCSNIVGAHAFVAVVAVALSMGCATPLPPSSAATPAAPPGTASSAAPRPAGFPDARYWEGLARGGRVYAIDAVQSLVVVLVLRGGPLAHLGHDHVVASRDLHGFIAPAEGRADLYVPLATLTVDEAELRAEAKFDTNPTEAAIAGTRENMLGPVLHVAEHPFALVSVTGLRRVADAAEFDAAITLNGVTRTFLIPATIEASAGALEAHGAFTLAQTDFAIAPFAVLGGALRVEDRVQIRYRLRAHLVAP